MHRSSDEVQALIALSDGEVGERDQRAGRASISLAMRFFLMLAVLFSVMAALPVPYLVFKSIYLLTHRDEDVSFHDMIKTDRVLFWVLGPVASVLAMLAVAPFNMYNTYKTLSDFRHHQFSMRSLSLRQIPYLIMRLMAFSFGVVNGYNMALAYNDVVGAGSVFSKFCRALTVAIATIFAGLDSRVVFDKFRQESPQDWRYSKRAAKYLGSRCGFFSAAIDSPRLVGSVEFSEEACDDHRQILFYGKSFSDLVLNKSLVVDTAWLTDRRLESFQTYSAFIKDDFPVWRYLAGDVLGGVLSLSLSVFNAFNTWNYARKATINFFEYLGVAQESNGLLVAGTGTAFVSSVVSVLMSFYLTRDLFFRDLFKNSDYSHLGKKLAVKVGTLIPALCFALLNVALTFMNDSLNPTTKILVSAAAILGSTTVLRYGIEGGLQAWRGHVDLRREFAKIPQKISEASSSSLALGAL